MLSSRPQFFNQDAYPISRDHGFLPDKIPTDSLPQDSELNKALNAIVHQLPELLKAKTLRKAIDDLNIRFSQDVIVTAKSQKNAAILIMLMLAQAYIWEDSNNPAKTVPAVIANSLYSLCKFKQRLPTMTYADYVLQNWKLIDPAKGFTLENVQPLFTFTGSADEAWFIKIHVVIEAASANALHAIYQACNLANVYKGSDALQKQAIYAGLQKHLAEVVASMLNANNLMLHMYDQCNPDYFWKVMRPYLGGWEKVKTINAEGKEQTGVFFEGIATKDKVPSFSFKGPSGAESSIVPALDAALGVKHDVDGMYQTLLAFQEYMPAKHTLFIKQMCRSKISQVVAQSEIPELREGLAAAIAQVARFRGAHGCLVNRYIYQNTDALGIPRHLITGTGGAPISEYLGGRTKTTRELCSELREPQASHAAEQSGSSQCPFKKGKK
jgi:indoleamine 2,3-dioxygenase